MAKKYVQEIQVDEEAGASALVLIRFEPGKASVRRALGLLSRCALEVLVRARDADGTHKPAQAAVRDEGGATFVLEDPEGSR